MSSKYKSNRKSIDDKLDKVIKAALWKATGNAVAPAQAETPVVTGTAQGSIQAKEPHKDGDRWIGEFGSYNVIYFIWLEIGTRFTSAHHMLRRAAEQEFPKVFDYLKDGWKAAT